MVQSPTEEGELVSGPVVVIQAISDSDFGTLGDPAPGRDHARVRGAEVVRVR